jgi:LDH2 family malate/lactate/ureidoglycolate dehydrogenase
MRLPIGQATELAAGILARHGVRAEYARMVADHLVDAALAGHAFAGLPRVLAIVDALAGRPPAGPIRIVREDARSAQIDGGDNVGYAVALVAIDKAIAIAQESGMAVVGANNTWFSGRLAYYVERAAAQGLIALHTANTTARVAPYGGIDAILGTNPFAMAFPCDPDPLVVDFGTSAATWGEVLLRKTTGRPLPDGWAVDPDGKPTTDPASALEGAILPWGGERGYGMALIAQVLGILVGSDVVIRQVSDSGFFFLVLDPALMMPLDTFKQRVAELVAKIHSSRPLPGGSPVRIPGERSQKRRALGRATATIDVDEEVYRRLLVL